MSSPLAIAAVTAVLKDLLNNGVINNDLSSWVGPVRVSSLAPDRVLTGGGQSEPSQLNLFLYHVAPNPAWRNFDYPSRDNVGNRVANPPLALDLHYLLTAYGGEDFAAEILLGYAMQLLHDTPVLTRAAIRAALTPTSPVTPAPLPATFSSLSAADLADQVELIKITPLVMGTEEMSKLWAAFQSHYRPTAVYNASVVLIDSRRTARVPQPVLSRGAVDPVTHRERGVIVQPSMLPPYPTIEDVVPPNAQTVVRMGDNLSFLGHHLLGVTESVDFRQLRTGRTLRLNVTGTPTNQQLTVQIPPDPPVGPPPPATSPLNPDNWQIGQYTASAVVSTGAPDPRISNTVGVILAPRITGITTTIAAGIVRFNVSISPKVFRGQRATLIVRDVEILGDPLATAQATVVIFQAPQTSLPTGTHRVRLRVDGAESITIDRSGSVPAFDPLAPTVTL